MGNSTIKGSHGKYPYHEGKHLLVPVELFTFGDESGIQASARYCLVLGFIGSPRQWVMFELQWKAILDEYGVTEFHAKEFFGRDSQGNRIGQYKGWSATKAEKYLLRLLLVIQQRRLFPVGGAVNVLDFNSFSYSERKFLTGGFINRAGTKWVTTGAPSKPYYFALNLFMIDALGNADHDASLHFFFDEQNVLQPRAIQTFKENLKAGPLARGLNVEQVKSIGFTSSIERKGLQLADMYAYAWNRYLIRGEHASEGIYQILDVITPKRAKRGPGIVIFGKPAFQRLLNKLPEDVRQKLKTDNL